MSYYFGAVCELVTDWQSLMLPPEADKRLTDPVKIEADLAKKRDAQRSVAAELPILSQLVSVCVLNTAGEAVIEAADPVAVVTKLRPWLLANVEQLLAGGSFELFGFDIRDRLRIFAAQCAIAAVPLPGAAWSFSYNDGRYAIDPYEDFFTAEFKKHVGVSTLISRVGFVLSGDSPTRAAQDAEDVRQLCSRLFGGRFAM